MPDVNHDTYDHEGVTGVPAAEAFDESAHDAHDHTGIPGVGGGSLGAWTDYTPSWTASTTNPTLGSSTITGRYKAIDSKTLALSINVAITTGGAWNAGSGTYRFSLPATYTSVSRTQLLAAHVVDSGTAHFAAIAKVGPSATEIAETVVADASAPRLLAHNVPVTWATGDQINVSGIIEVA